MVLQGTIFFKNFSARRAPDRSQMVLQSFIFLFIISGLRVPDEPKYDNVLYFSKFFRRCARRAICPMPDVCCELANHPCDKVTCASLRVTPSPMVIITVMLSHG